MPTPTVSRYEMTIDSHRATIETDAGRWKVTVIATVGNTEIPFEALFYDTDTEGLAEAEAMLTVAVQVQTEAVTAWYTAYQTASGRGNQPDVAGPRYKTNP